MNSFYVQWKFRSFHADFYKLIEHSLLSLIRQFDAFNYTLRVFAFFISVEFESFRTFNWLKLGSVFDSPQFSLSNEKIDLIVVHFTLNESISNCFWKILAVAYRWSLIFIPIKPGNLTYKWFNLFKFRKYSKNYFNSPVIQRAIQYNQR